MWLLLHILRSKPRNEGLQHCGGIGPGEMDQQSRKSCEMAGGAEELVKLKEDSLSKNHRVKNKTGRGGEGDQGGKWS